MKQIPLISALSLLLFALALIRVDAANLAIYSGPTNSSWISQEAAITNAEVIMNDARIKTIFENIENYGDGDEVGYDSPLGKWMQAHTGNGQQDVFIAASGTSPSAIYRYPNLDPDGSNIENFIEDGNVFINVGDYILYMSYEGGRRRADNGPEGAANVFDIPWLRFWPRGGLGNPPTPMVPTEVGKKYLPSLEIFGSDRPWHLEKLLGTDWEVTAFAVANDDPYSADPAVAVNRTYGGIIAAMWQKKQANWKGDDPRASGVIEFIANWLTEHGSITTSDQDNPATTWGRIKPTNDSEIGTDHFQGVENMVHLIYFLPRNRPPQPNIDIKLDVLIRNVQQFYANQMQRHGFNSKTFTFETDENGKAVVHHLNGQFTDAYYQTQTVNKVNREMPKQFNTSKYVYLVAIDISSEFIGVGDRNNVCGAAIGTWDTYDNQVWWKKDLGGMIVIPASGRCFSPITIGHELGHFFGLVHDFRDNDYLMGYGTSLRLSQCAAEWLSVHRYFNTNETLLNENTTISTRSQRGGYFQFQVTDPDGLHQAQLLIPTTVDDPSSGTKLHSCKTLNGKKSSTVAFVANELAGASGKKITLQVIDVHGNIAKEKFPIQTDSVVKENDDDTTVSISPSFVQSPPIGEQLTFTLHITDGTAVAGYQATVQFDTTALNYIESENGNYLPEGAFFVPSTISGNTVQLAVTAFPGESNGDGMLATLTFEVVAVKPSTLTLSEVILSDSESKLSYPEVENGEVIMPNRVIGDVNSDGVVNIQDLVIVGSSLGQTGQTDADVTGDGVVNIADLVKVAGAIGMGATAPSALSQALEMLTTAEVQLWLTQIQHADLTDPISQRGIMVLEQLLAVLVPKETALLPNYPNPFNPETWIPYQLAINSNVKITIYNTKGVVVRTLAIGHQSAGYYTDRSRAAYWNGENQVGEPVASDIYFYTLSTEEFTATQKMLIRK